MKTCAGCEQDLPDSAFGVNNALPDGLARKCRACTRAYAKAWRKKTLPAWERKTQQPGYAAQAKKAYWKRHPEKKRARERVKTQRRRWKEMARRGLATVNFLLPDEILKRRRARKSFAKLVERGVVTRQCCFVCGESNAHAHHADYDRPRDVVWLCKPHHREVHAMVQCHVSFLPRLTVV